MYIATFYNEAVQKSFYTATQVFHAMPFMQFKKLQEIRKAIGLTQHKEQP